MTTTSSLGKYSNNNSLCHCLIRLIQKETASSLSPASDGNSFTSVLRPAFQLAATLTISPECRGVMWKVFSCTLAVSFLFTESAELWKFAGLWIFLCLHWSHNCPTWPFVRPSVYLFAHYRTVKWT